VASSPSSIDQRGGSLYQTTYSNVADLKFRTQSLTLGSNQAVTPWLTNEVRFNYSRSRSTISLTLDDFGGAMPPTELGYIRQLLPRRTPSLNF
jgi:hypothetical protein